MQTYTIYGGPTIYGLYCGYVKQIDLGTRLILFMEHSHFHVQVFDGYSNKAVHWEVFDTHKEAKEYWRRVHKKLFTKKDGILRVRKSALHMGYTWRTPSGKMLYYRTGEYRIGTQVYANYNDALKETA